MAGKTCSHCGAEKPLSEFHVRRNRPTGTASRCKSCESDRKREWNALPEQVKARAKYYSNYREEVLDRHRFVNFQLTRAEFNALLLEQGGVCAVCKQPETRLDKDGNVKALTVDHDHECCPETPTCGQCTRGLLCSTCNLGIGQLGDTVEALQRALDYLLKYRDRAVLTEGCG